MERSEQSVPAILIADDDALIGLVLSKALESRGYEVAVAQTREASIRACAESVFDLAIVDAHMPGAELQPSLALMANSKPVLHTMVISGDAERPKWLSTEIAFLSKPFDLNALLGEVERLLGSRALPATRSKGPIR